MSNEQEKARKNIREKIEELTAKINELKIQVVESSLKTEYEGLIKEMEKIRDRMQEKYNRMEASREEEWTELDRNLFGDVKSFDTAFKKAGALFKPREKEEDSGKTLNPGQKKRPWKG